MLLPPLIFQKLSPQACLCLQCLAWSHLILNSRQSAACCLRTPLCDLQLESPCPCSHSWLWGMLCQVHSVLYSLEASPVYSLGIILMQREPEAVASGCVVSVLQAVSVFSLCCPSTPHSLAPQCSHGGWIWIGNGPWKTVGHWLTGKALGWIETGLALSPGSEASVSSTLRWSW